VSQAVGKACSRVETLPDTGAGVRRGSVVVVDIQWGPGTAVEVGTAVVVVRKVSGLEALDRLGVSMRVVEDRAVGKLPQAERTVVVRMSHNSHLVVHHKESAEEDMAKHSVLLSAEFLSGG
jgi:hypothetical protein